MALKVFVDVITFVHDDYTNIMIQLSDESSVERHVGEVI